MNNLTNNTKKSTVYSHQVIISGSYHERIAVVNYDGSTIWELCNDKLWLEVNDSDMFDNGDIVYAMNTLSGCFVRRISPDYLNHRGYSIIWEFAVPKGAENHTCQILPDDGVLLGLGYDNYIKIVELDKDGKIRKILGDDKKSLQNLDDIEYGSHFQVRQVRYEYDGHYIITHCRKNITVEYDENGNLIQTYPFGGKFSFTGVKDKSGNVLISGGDNKKIEIYSPEAKLIRVIDNDNPKLNFGFAAAIRILDNDNLLIANYGGHGGLHNGLNVFEFNLENNNIVWKLETKDSYNISNVRIVEKQLKKII